MLKTIAGFVMKQLPKTRSYSTATTADQMPLICKLAAEFDDVGRIVNVIEREDLKNVDFENWKERIHLLKLYDFKDSECFKMISKYPPLLKIPYEQMKSSISCWYDCEFGTQKFQYLLFFQPQLLEIPETDLKKRIPYLKNLYRSDLSIVNLIAACPNIMFEDWDAVVEKFDFLVTEKGIQKGDILKTKALSQSLDFLQLRFFILEKCGIFQKPETLPHKKRRFNSSGHKNPNLKAIVDYSDISFSKNVAKISLEEYQVCSDLFQEAKYEDDDDDDDECVGGYGGKK